MVVKVTGLSYPRHVSEEADLLARALGMAPQVFLFLDYGGTLIPSTGGSFWPCLPEQEDYPEECVRERLEELGNEDSFSIFVLSGRSVGELDSLLKVDNIGLIGQRGLEIRRRYGEIEHPVELPANLPGLLDHIELEAHRRIHPYGNVRIDNRGFALTLRLVASDEPEAKAASHKFVTVIREFDSGGQLEVLYCGDRVEARVAGWHKGNAVSHILRDADPFEALAIYLGDDVTDEDAFESLRDWSEQEDAVPPWIMGDEDDDDAPSALPILVADRPRPTVAPLFVRGSDEVYEFLCSLVAITSTLL